MPTRPLTKCHTNDTVITTSPIALATSQSIAGQCNSGFLENLRIWVTVTLSHMPPPNAVRAKATMMRESQVALLMIRMRQATKIWTGVEMITVSAGSWRRGPC